MTSFLNTLAVIVVLIGVFGAIGIWPEGRNLPPFAYTVPLAILLNSAILAGVLAGLATLIDHVDSIRQHLVGQSGLSGAAQSKPDSQPAAVAADSGEMKRNSSKVDHRGLSADGRMQVLANYRVHQHADGLWRVEHLDGSPHEAVPDTFSTLGAAKRAAAKVL